jgi:hypothetical protein
VVVTLRILKLADNTIIVFKGLTIVVTAKHLNDPEIFEFWKKNSLVELASMIFIKGWIVITLKVNITTNMEMDVDC